MKFILLFGWAMSIASASAGESKSEKYPYGLITPGYGIVTDDDLAFDASRREMKPYDPTDTLGPLRWQCFATKDVDAKYKSWRGPDGMGAWNKIYTMCTIEISIHHNGELHSYSDRRGHQVGWCRDFIRSWKWITKGQEFVCLNGDGGGYEKSAGDGKYKSWTWEKFKTKKGCYSYFAGECNTKGCAKGRCPKT
jgi:hypothetical protein